MPSSKPCITCKEAKPLSDFYAHPGMADGHLNKCKPCVRAAVAARREEKIDEIRAYDRDRAKKPHRRSLAARVAKAWRDEDKRRMAAHNAVHRAVRAGTLIPQPCERCGSIERIHAHHDDYSKPLDVRWLCPIDHKARHKELRNGN